MLINLSNHPLSKWSDAQRKAAEAHFGREIIDIPFAPVDPKTTFADVKKTVDEYIQLCLTHLHQYENYTAENAIHIMGEYTFTFQFVKEMEARNILCVASTTERIVTDNPDGSKNTVFKFVRFRPYFTLDR